MSVPINISKAYQELKVTVIVNDGVVAGIELEDESEYLEVMK